MNVSKLFFVVLVVLVGVMLWPRKSIPPATHSFIDDSSLSTVDGCACLKEHGRSKIYGAIRHGEVMALYAIGDATTAYQPRLVWSKPIPFDQTVTGDKAKWHADVEAMLGELESACRTIPRTKESPLVEAVKVVLEQMRPQCPPESRCDITMLTDLREEVNVNFVKRFQAAKRGKLSGDLPLSLDNAGIAVAFTGVSETAPTTKVKADTRQGEGDIWQRLWKELFTHGEQVTFEPICAPPRLLSTARATH